VQVVVLMFAIHCAWLRIAGEMPLPLGPVPGNSALSGMVMSANQ
jgi:hypothetical protein